MPASDLWLGDLLRARAALKPADDATWEAMRAMLRDVNSPGPAAASSPSERAVRLAPAPIVPEPFRHDDWPITEPDVVEQPPASPHTPRRRTSVTPLAREPAPAPGVPAPFVDSAVRRRRAPALLISQRIARGIATAMAARPMPGRDPDIPKLLHHIALREPTARLPMRDVWSLAHRAQLLVDRSAALVPVLDDVVSIETELLRVIGGGRLDRLSFSGSPLRAAGAGVPESWTPWRPPAPDTTLLVITDLGCAGSRANPDWAGPRQWLEFAELARANGVVPVALIPYAPDRIPARLTRAFVVLHWNERLDAAQVQRRIRDAIGRRR